MFSETPSAESQSDPSLCNPAICSEELYPKRYDRPATREKPLGQRTAAKPDEHLSEALQYHASKARPRHDPDGTGETISGDKQEAYLTPCKDFWNVIMSRIQFLKQTQRLKPVEKMLCAQMQQGRRHCPR
jgi:hypothetical protein